MEGIFPKTFNGFSGLYWFLTPVKSLDCYACGLAMVDPIAELFPYNLESSDPEGKMYNESCTLFATYQIEHPDSMKKWVRPCPLNVKSCFWAEGSYQGESKFGPEISKTLLNLFIYNDQ